MMNQDNYIQEILVKILNLKKEYLLNNKINKEEIVEIKNNNFLDNDSLSMSTVVSNDVLINKNINSLNIKILPYKEEYRTNEFIEYFNTIKSILMDLTALLIKKNNKIDIKHMNSIYEILGINFIDKSEIDLFFLFLNDLINLKDKKIYFTESVFTEYFYKVLVRLDYKEYTIIIYKCLENMLLFLNLKLNIITLENFFEIKIKESFLIGSEIIVNLLINSNQKVKNCVVIFVNNIIKAVINKYPEYVNLIYDVYCKNLISNLFEIYENYFRDGNFSKIISIIDSLIYFIEKVDNINLKENNSELIELNIIDNSDQLSKKFKLKIEKKNTLKGLKGRIIDFLELRDTNLLLFSKGKNLIGDDFTLMELGILNEDKIIINDKSNDWIDLENKNSELLKDQSKQLMEIFPNVDFEFSKFLIIRFHYNLELIIEKLFNELEGNLLKVQFDNQISEMNKKDVQIINKNNTSNKIFLRNKIAENKNIFYIIFKLKDLLKDDDNDDSKNIINKFLKLIPSNTLLINNIKLFIENNKKDNKKLLEEAINFENYSQTSDDLIIINKNETDKKNIFEDNEMFNFNLNNILETPNSLNLYKLKIFKKMLGFNGSSYDNSDITDLINIKFNFINNGLIYEVDNIIQDMLVKNDSKKEVILKILIKIIRPYYYILEFSDLNNGYKKLKNFNLDLGYLSDESKKKEKSEKDNPFQFVNNSPKSNITPGFSFGISKSNSYKKFENENISICKSNNYTINSKISNSMEEFQLFFKKINKSDTIKILKANLNTSIFFVNIMEYLINYNYVKEDTEPDIFDIIFKIIVPLSEIKNGEILKIEQIINLFNKLKTINSNFISNFIIRVLFSVEIKNNIKEEIKKIIFLNFFNNYEVKFSNNYFVTSSYCVEYLEDFKEKIYIFTEELIKKIEHINNEKKWISIISIFKQIYIKFKNIDFSIIIKNVINLIFINLFDIYEDNKSKISSPKHRKGLFNFLEFIMLKDIEFLFLIMDNILKYIPISNEDIFKYSLDVKKKEIIGIKNLGATCYMNSFIQQLYYTQNFTNRIINSKISKENFELDLKNNDYKENIDTNFNNLVLYQMILIFCNLKKSIKEYHNPKEFCEIFTGFDNLPMNISIQQDVNEFLNLLFSSLESEFEVYNKENKNIIKDFFNVSCVSEIISLEDDYPFKSENKEYYTSICLEVKNFNSIEDSLDNYLKGDILENENAYFCEKYNKKLKVNKKLYLNELPSNMIFTWNRFEYNYVTGEKIKINNYYEIPLEINFEKWLKNKEQKIYKLVGVIVHSGTTEFGHYYSYIQTNKKWYKFDDIQVTEFYPNKENMKQEWFGQSNKIENYHNLEFQSTSSKNAYMLFYEEKGLSEFRNYQNITIPPFLSQKMDLDNNNYLKNRILSDTEYCKFIVNYFNSFKNFSKVKIINYILDININLKDNKILNLFLEKNNKKFYQYLEDYPGILKSFPSNVENLDLSLDININENIFISKHEDIKSDVVNCSFNNSFNLD